MRRTAVAAAAPLAALLLLGACKVAEQKQAEAVDTAAVADQLRASEADWKRDYAAKDAVKLAGHYAEDAALANPGVPLVTGGDSIRAAVKGFAADANLKVDFASDRIQVAKSGDLAYTRGHYTMESTDSASGKPRTDGGNYLTVWQKQADGSWKAVEDFVTPGAAMTPAITE